MHISCSQHWYIYIYVYCTNGFAFQCFHFKGAKERKLYWHEQWICTSIQGSVHTGRQWWSASTTTQPSFITAQAILTTTRNGVNATPKIHFDCNNGSFLYLEKPFRSLWAEPCYKDSALHVHWVFQVGTVVWWCILWSWGNLWLRAQKHKEKKSCYPPEREGNPWHVYENEW